jgi:multidrug efflux pump subunit AcrA (membrane-fusion protein)
MRFQGYSLEVKNFDFWLFVGDLKRGVLGRAGLAIVLCFALAACGSSGSDESKAKGDAAASGKGKAGAEEVVVEIARARALSGGQEVVATGAFRREREIDLAFRIPGVLREINYREGDIVAQGAIVATIDPTQVEAQIAEAQAQATQASAGVGQAQEQVRSAAAAISSAQAGQAQAIASAAQAEANSGRAQATLAQARADMDNARREFQRDQALANKGFVSPARLDARQTRLDVASANVRAAEAGVVAAQQTAIAARAGISVAGAGVNQAQASSGAAIAGVRAASGRADAARAGVNAAAFDRRWARLVSPASGVVLTRVAEPGEITAPGQPVLVLADEKSPLILRTPVSDRDVARVKVGDAARVTISSIGTEVSGRVSRVAQRADPQTGAFDVDIQVDPRAPIKTGFFAEARILATSGDLAPKGQVVIPAEALIEAREGAASLFTLAGDNKTAKRVRVGFVGFRGGEAIVTGLAIGSAIVTAGGAYVTDGSVLLPVERKNQ